VCVKHSDKIKRAIRVTTIFFMPDVPYTVAKACPRTLYQSEKEKDHQHHYNLTTNPIVNDLQ
jgi:hypothetical protein